MIKSNRLKTAVLTAAVTGAVCVSVFLFLTERYGYRKYDNSGIPDAVSSVCEGGECRLTVVANSGEIDDEGEFAEEVIDMCRENAFRSLRFSTDLEGWPSSLDIRVYLHKEDIGSSDPVMRVLFEPPDDGEAYDIRDDRERYRLTIQRK